jgi:hypothetical protein
MEMFAEDKIYYMHHRIIVKWSDQKKLLQAVKIWKI